MLVAFCMVGNLKKWKEGTLRREFHIKGHALTLEASLRRGDSLTAEQLQKTHHSGGTNYWVDFTWDNPNVSFAVLRKL